MIHELVEQGVLSAEDEGNQGFGIQIKLQQGMKLCEDLDAHQVSFVDDQDGVLFSCRDFRQECLERFGEEGDGEGSRLHLERKQDLFEEFENGSGIGRHGNHPVLRGMKGSGGIPEGGGFTGSHFSRDDTDGAELKGVDKPVGQGLEAGQRIKVLDPDILRKGISLKAEKVLIANHRFVSFRRVFHPGRRVSPEVKGDNPVAVQCRCAPCFV